MEKRVLYFDCFSGISGDMTIGALLDLGIDQNVFLNELKKLKLDEFEIEIKKGLKKGVSGTDFTVHLLHQETDIDEHQDEHHHGHEHKHEHTHQHHHDHEHKHDHAHHHKHELKHEHHHAHNRNLADIYSIIDESELSEYVKVTSKAIFLVVAEAEAKIHSKSIDDVHFHEVGAVDSIVDIVGAAICIELLKVDEIQCSEINLGGGFVKCEHGVFPVPAPATLEILKSVPVYSQNAKKELTTPTGAAIVKALCSSFGTFPAFTIEKTGYGLGKRDMETPNVLRVIIGTKKLVSNFVMLETNIDNMNPEIYTYLFPKLLENGALDVFVTPIVMKKSRPANILSVLCKAENVEFIEDIIFTETTTLGIRKYVVDRSELDRRFEKVSTKYGDITLKIAYRNGRSIKFSPEFEDCNKIATATGVPILQIMDEAIKMGQLYLGQL